MAGSSSTLTFRVLGRDVSASKVLKGVGSQARRTGKGLGGVVDAVDRMSIKALIIGTCRRNGTPVLTVGSAGGRRDPTQIKMVDLGLAGRDLLLQQTRRKLRRDFDFPKSANGVVRSTGSGFHDGFVLR